MPSLHVNKHGQTIKGNPKRKWRTTPKERRKIRSAFTPKVRPLKESPARNIIVVIQKEIKRLGAEKGMLGEEKIVKSVLSVVGYNRAKEFVERHPDILADAAFNGFSRAVFGDQPPVVFNTSSLTTQRLRQDRNLARQKPRQWYANGLQRLRRTKTDLKPVIAKDYWTVVNKLLEREAKKVIKNFMDNAVNYLDHRKFDIHDPAGKLYPASAEYLGIIEKNFSKEILYGEFGFEELERAYIKLDKSNRTNFQNLRTKVRKIVIEEIANCSAEFEGRKIKLMKGSPKHRAIIRGIVTQTFRKGVIEFNTKNKMPSDKVLAGRVSRLVNREITKIKRAIQEEVERTAELTRTEKQKTPRITRERRIRQYIPKERTSKPERRAGEKGEDSETKKSIKKIKSKTLFNERFMIELKKNAPETFIYIKRRHSEGWLDDKFVGKLKLRLVRVGLSRALKNGFERTFPPEASPVLIDALATLGNETMRWTDYVPKVMNSPFRKPVTEFLVKTNIIGRHHQKGVSINRNRQP